MNKQPITIWSLQEAERYHVHSPGLASWLVDHLNPLLKVYDFGCGKGTYVKTLIENGFAAMGFEGTPGIETIADTKSIVSQDITLPMMPPRDRGSVVCLEVMEHILPEKESSVLKNISNYCNGNGTLILSWAIPGQNGHGHNNCRPAHYVIEQMYAHGFCYDERSTKSARQAAISGDLYLRFFLDSLHVFQKLPPPNNFQK